MKNTVHKFDNIFSKSELALLEKAIEKRQPRVHETLGREESYIIVPDSILNKVSKLVNSVSSVSLVANTYVVYVEYNGKYGEPNLPPHFDGDTNELVLDFQFLSNAPWGIGVNLDVYELKDNCAISFNANTNIHWRPIKDFQDGEFLQMIFFRFYNPKEPSDYSHHTYSQDHEIFKEVHEYRNSLYGIANG